jgi:hypothetical protein
MTEPEDELELEIGADIDNGEVFLVFERNIRSVSFTPAGAIHVAESLIAMAKRLQN